MSKKGGAASLFLFLNEQFGQLADNILLTLCGEYIYICLLYNFNLPT